jgi:hypothetical protein
MSRSHDSIIGRAVASVLAGAVVIALASTLAGCSPAMLPDTAELARSSAEVANGLDAAHRHTRQTLAGAFTGLIPCSEIEDEPLEVHECFARLFKPRVEAARAIAEYAATLTEIFAAGRGDHAPAMADAASTLLARLGMPALPAAIRGVAEAALDTWTKRRAAATAGAVVTSADPHVQALVVAVVADLEEVRGLLVAARRKLILELVLQHDDELALRQALEQRRHELLTQIPDQNLDQNPDQTPGAPAAPPGQPTPAGVAAELAAIQSTLAALPRQEDLRPAGVDEALAVVDAAQAALAEWGLAHHRLVIALQQGRSPELGLLTAAVTTMRTAVRALEPTKETP